MYEMAEHIGNISSFADRMRSLKVAPNPEVMRIKEHEGLPVSFGDFNDIHKKSDKRIPSNLLVRGAPDLQLSANPLEIGTRLTIVYGTFPYRR